MQAGLVAKRLTFRDIFTAAAAFLSFVAALIRVRWQGQPRGHRELTDWPLAPRRLTRISCAAAFRPAVDQYLIP